MSQDSNAKICPSCKGTTFYLDSGFYVCTQCCTQLEDAREEVHDGQYDATTRVHKIRIKKQKSEKDIVGWTSWELYNLVLLGMTNELIEIGADPDIKLTVLQLWTYYLKNLEVAFTSQTKKSVPKMARRYHKKDAEIIYGKIQKKKRSRKKSSSNASMSSPMTSFVSSGSDSRKNFFKSQRLLIAEHNESIKSRQSSDTDANSSLNQSLVSLKSSISQNSSNVVKIRFNKKAKLEAKKVKEMSKKVPRSKRKNFKQKHINVQYATGPDVLTPLKLWSLIYLALRIHNQPIYASDMLRFGREGHLTYYRLDNLLPSEVSLNRSDILFLSQSVSITHKGLRRTTAGLAKFLNVTELPNPDILDLIKRYCEDLELPRGILLYAERLYLSSPSILNFSGKSSLIPNYEGRAMAYIIVVLKVLFGMDNVTEKEISRVVDNINKIGTEKDSLTSRLFSFGEWQQFAECRRSVLASMHFPSKAKYEPECPGAAHLYLRFMGLLKSKRDFAQVEGPNPLMSQLLIDAIHRCIDKLNEASTTPLKEMEVFPPSFTPLRSYVAALNDNSHYDVPYVLRTNFYETKVGYVTRPDSLVELASHCGMRLEVVDTSLQYLEKIVPPFELPKMPEIKELCENVKVVAPAYQRSRLCEKYENLLDYSHRNRPCKMKVKAECLKCYFSVCMKIPELEESLDFEENSGFDHALQDGRLDIKVNSDSEDESTLDNSNLDATTSANDTFEENEKFFKNRNIKLYKHELESLHKTKDLVRVKKVRARDASGKFIKSPAVKVKKEYKRIVSLDSQDSSGDEANSKVKKVRKKRSKKSDKNNVKDEAPPIDVSDSSESDISIVDEDVTIVNETTLKTLSTVDDKEILFRPYKDYWMYHCNFSRVKGKDFDLLEKELPENFVWLLNECADVVEMPVEDLYEEVCLIEAYHLNLAKSKKEKKSKKDKDYVFHDCTTKAYMKNVLNKW